MARAARAPFEIGLNQLSALAQLGATSQDVTQYRYQKARNEVHHTIQSGYADSASAVFAGGAIKRAICLQTLDARACRFTFMHASHFWDSNPAVLRIGYIAADRL